jgi:hypothetical protein
VLGELAVGIRRPGTPTTKPTSASTVEPPRRPEHARAQLPAGRSIGVPETTTVPARPW